MTARNGLIRNLAMGDIFHAEAPNGASLVCLITDLTEDAIKARTITTQYNIEFDRDTGLAELDVSRVLCKIDSVMSLPEDIHSVMLGIDRKFSLEKDPERLKLSKEEKQALICVESHYKSNPIIDRA